MSRLTSHVRAFALLPFVALVLACEEDPADPDPCDSASPPASCNPVEDGFAFAYTPPAGAPAIASIFLSGSFNGWSTSATPMQLQPNGAYVAYVDLDSATTYQYKFVINGTYVGNMCGDETWGHPDLGYRLHADTDACVDDTFGGANGIIRLGALPLDYSHSASDPADVSIVSDELSVRFAAAVGRVHAAWLEVGDDSLGMYVQFQRGLQDIWRGTAPGATSSYTIRLLTDEGVLTRGPYTVPANLLRSVDWVSDAVGYQIFPERFWNGDPSNDSLALSTDEFEYNELWTSGGPTLASSWTAAPNGQHCCHQYYGGDIAGIIEKMPELVELGVTVIYLNPIWHNGSAHGYDTFDYDRLAPEFGDSTILRSFVDQAHASGIRVIWDFVPNHVGLGYPAFIDAGENGDASPYRDWFNIHPDGDGFQAGDGDDYDGWWGIGSLPELQTEVPEVLEYLMSVAENWTEYGFDGIRVDVAPDIDNRSEFFGLMRERTKAINPDVYLVGEVWTRDPSWLRGDQVDALMNYSIARDVVAGFARDEMTASSAWAQMVEMWYSYPDAATAMLFNLTASHDTGRFLTLLGGGDQLDSDPSAATVARQKLGAALQYALPGMPVTYYGDECGMTGTNTGSIHLSRRTMDWDKCAADVNGIRAHYIQLAGLKHDLPALGSSVIRAHVAAGDVLSFLRGEPGPGEVLAAFNQGGSARNLALPAGTWVNAVTGATVSGSVSIPTRGWVYLVRQ